MRPINWNEWAGATHALTTGPEWCGAPWMQGDVRLVCIEKGVGVDRKGEALAIDRRCWVVLAERPAVWNGEGLPPEGVECEYSIGEPSWYLCKVRYVLKCDPDPEADGWQAVIWCPHLEKDQLAEARTFKFRPLRTAEDLAREAAIDDLCSKAARLSGRTASQMHRPFWAAWHDTHGVEHP